MTRTYYERQRPRSGGQLATNAEVGGTVKVEITFNSIDLNFPFVPFLDNAKVVPDRRGSGRGHD